MAGGDSTWAVHRAPNGKGILVTLEPPDATELAPDEAEALARALLAAVWEADGSDPDYVLSAIPPRWGPRPPLPD
jgi:hypothetical protein